MNTPKHSPGQWTVDKYEDDAGIQTACICGPGGYLFGVSCSDRTTIDGADLANLTLAAAAPAMLAALTNARAVLAVALAWPNSAEIRKQMDSAIARATEVQP